MRLKDKVAIITGVGAGIGEAIAVRFAEEGARLVWPDIQEPAGRATLDKVTAMGGGGNLCAGRYFQGGQREAYCRGGPAAWGGIDILVNNAADFTQKSVEKAELADWQRVPGRERDRPGDGFKVRPSRS